MAWHRDLAARIGKNILELKEVETISIRNQIRSVSGVVARATRKITLTQLRKTKDFCSSHAAFKLKGGHPQGNVAQLASFQEEEGKARRRQGDIQVLIYSTRGLTDLHRAEHEWSLKEHSPILNLLKCLQDMTKERFPQHGLGECPSSLAFFPSHQVMLFFPSLPLSCRFQRSQINPFLNQTSFILVCLFLIFYFKSKPGGYCPVI